jgi:hypothetical protein
MHVNRVYLSKRMLLVVHGQVGKRQKYDFSSSSFYRTHPQEVLLDLLLRLTATKQQFPFLIQHFTQEEKPNSSSSSLPSISYKSQLQQQQQQQMSLSFSPAKAC